MSLKIHFSVVWLRLKILLKLVQSIVMVSDRLRYNSQQLESVSDHSVACVENAINFLLMPRIRNNRLKAFPRGKILPQQVGFKLGREKLQNLGPLRFELMVIM